MDRLACVDVPALPLQLLLRAPRDGEQRPDSEGRPTAVVEHDKPQARVLWVDERARALGVLPGMRYAAALSLAHGLHAGVVDEHQVDAAVRELTAALQRFSPEVEPAVDEPGVFWLDAGGLERLYPSLTTWAGQLVSELEELSYNVLISIGFSKFGSYASVKSGKGVVVLRDPRQEQTLARWVPLARLGIDPGFRDALHKLGVTTLGGLVELPAAGIRERFGAEAHRLHRMAAGDLWTPLRPAPIAEPTRRSQLLTEPVSDTALLLFQVKRLLHPLLAELDRAGQAVTGLTLQLGLERGADHVERIRPAAPTVDGLELLLLLRLQLESVQLAAGVLELHLDVDAVDTRAQQEALIGDRPRRDLAAADRALSFVQAEFGPGSVLRARLRSGHLPEASFCFEPLRRLTPPRPRDDGRPTLVRRLLDRPEPLGPPDGGRDAGDDRGGPYVIQGGWWARTLRRDYHYRARREGGELLWTYRDRIRGRWMLQGRVE